MLINLATIWNELAAAGLGSLSSRVVLGSDGSIGGELTEAERAAVQAVLDAHDPTAPAPASRVLTRVQFLQRLTPAEWWAARTSSTPEVQYFVDLILAAQEIDLDSAQTQAGLDIAVQAGILSTERRADVDGQLIEVHPVIPQGEKL